jgi:hypothetical protein
MCGLALGVKMLAGAVLLFALAALVWGFRREPNRSRALWHIIAFAVIALAVASPWYLKSFLWTGNPVYPFFYQQFDGRYWSADRALLYTEAQRSFGLGQGPSAFLALPWNLTMRPRWFFDDPGALRDFSIWVTVFGPLLLAFVPTLLVSGRLGAPGRLALWFALTYTAIWFAMSQNGRYLIPILPGLCACAGVAASKLLERGSRTRAAAVTALVLGLLSVFLPSFLIAAPAARAAWGMEARSAYLARTSQLYPMFEAVNRATPASATIMVLGHEPRCFHLDRDFLLGDHTEILSRADRQDAETFLRALKRLGVTHLLLHMSVVRDMAARSGGMGTLLADLEEQGAIVPQGAFESLTLWELANTRSESAQ